MSEITRPQWFPIRTARTRAFRWYKTFILQNEKRTNSGTSLFFLQNNREVHQS